MKFGKSISSSTGKGHVTKIDIGSKFKMAAAAISNFQPIAPQHRSLRTVLVGLPLQCLRLNVLVLRSFAKSLSNPDLFSFFPRELCHESIAFNQAQVLNKCFIFFSEKAFQREAFH